MSIPKFLLRGFRRPHDVLTSVLGRLELRVMDELWRRQEMSVRDMHQAFEERTAYTTLMTTLNRLHKKGLLNRRKDGRAFLIGSFISETGASLTSRIGRLTRLDGIRAKTHPINRAGSVLTPVPLCCCLFTFMVILITRTDILLTIHNAVEYFVAALQ